MIGNPVALTIRRHIERPARRAGQQIVENIRQPMGSVVDGEGDRFVHHRTIYGISGFVR